GGGGGVGCVGLGGVAGRRGFGSRCLDVPLQGRPAREAVLAREHELRVRERDALLVRELATHARVCGLVTVAPCAQQLLRELLLLFERCAGREGTIGCGHGEPLSSRPGVRTIGPKEVDEPAALTGWALPFPRTGGVP